MKSAAYIVLLGAGFLVPVFSQPQDPDGDDRPGRGVARLSVLNGEVSVRRGDSGDLVAAAINAPIVVEDRVLTGPASRAELQFDRANMLRLGSNAEVRLSELEYRRYQVQVAQGTTTFRVLRDSDAQVEISTPTVSVRPMGRGVYRVTVLEDGSSEITVRGGEAEIYSPRGSERLQPGRTMLARGTAADPEFQMVAAPRGDDWDRWNENRDRDLERSQSARYVGSDIYGAEDLDGYGTWTEVPSYGRVWRPTVVADWAPYRAGRWVWVDYYGWTWVSYDPWGWAPYHYGRWFSDPSLGWCWWPGASYSRTYWRPALVAFFGWGGHNGYRSGIGFGYGNIGWVPLAPYEPFHAWYGRGYYDGYRGGTVINNTTIVNNTNIINIYRNARINNGITAVNSNDFGRGHIGDANRVRVSGADVERAGLVRGQIPLTPGRESLRMADRQVRTPDASRANENRQFYSHAQPTRVDRVPFEQQQQRMEQVARRTFGDGSIRSGEAAAPLSRGEVYSGRGSAAAGVPSGMRPSSQVGPSISGRPSAEQDGGWRRAGEAAANPNTTAPAQTAPGSGRDTSWHRFGDPGGHASAPGAGVQDSGVPANRPADTGYSRGGRPDIQSGRGYTQPVQPENNAPSDRGGWRRFGEANPGGGTPAGRYNAPVERQAAPAPVDRNYGGRGAERPSRNDGAVQHFGGYDAGSRYGGGSEPVRISPPIVHERAMPVERQAAPPPIDRGYRGYGGSGGERPGRGDGGFRNFGGGSEPARVSPPMVHERAMPERAAPRMEHSIERSAPPQSRGDGGGRAPDNGGGGGGRGGETRGGGRNR